LYLRRRIEHGLNQLRANKVHFRGRWYVSIPLFSQRLYTFTKEQVSAGFGIFDDSAFLSRNHAPENFPYFCEKTLGSQPRIKQSSNVLRRLRETFYCLQDTDGLRHSHGEWFSGKSRGNPINSAWNVRQNFGNICAQAIVKIIRASQFTHLSIGNL